MWKVCNFERQKNSVRFPVCLLCVACRGSIHPLALNCCAVFAPCGLRIERGKLHHPNPPSCSWSTAFVWARGWSATPSPSLLPHSCWLLPFLSLAISQEAFSKALLTWLHPVSCSALPRRHWASPLCLPAGLMVSEAHAFPAISLLSQHREMMSPAGA